MTESRIREIIAKGEGLTVEFKTARRSLPRNLFETICAFLNRVGGDILLGVDDTGEVVGIDAEKIENLKIDLCNLSNNPEKINPPFMLFPQEIQIDNKWIIYLRVPQSSQVHSTGNMVFDRNADGDFKITTHAALQKIYARKSTYFTENKIFPYLQFSDFNKDIFKKVRNLIQSHRPDHPWLEISDKEVLTAAGLYKKDFETGEQGYTLGAVLIFGKNEVIQQILPHYKTDALLRRRDQIHYDDRREIRTNLIDAYDELMQFIRIHLPDKFYMEGDVRVDLREKIFREVVANILIHREYLNAFQARLIICRDRLIAENANNPIGYGPIDPENFNPHPKNPTIMKFFQQIGRAEELGSGVRNIRKYLPFYVENGHFEMIEADNFRTVLDLKLDDFWGEATQKTTQKTTQKIVWLIKANPRITRKELAEKIGITQDGIKYNLDKLKRQGILKRVGPDKGGHWEIIGRGAGNIEKV